MKKRKGHGDAGAGIYINGASADAVLLRSPVDYGTTEFDLGLAYDGERLHLNGQLAYSDFDNDDELLVWQNPYNSYGPNVAYPDGTGGLGLAPDNEQTSGRLIGHYLFSSKARLQFDTSYALASQDQNYADYTVNEALLVTVPVPHSDFNGEVATSTGNISLLLNPLPKLSTELFYKLRDRDYDADRDGYLYVRGDGSDQPDSPLTVYNTNHDLTSQTAGLEGQLPTAAAQQTERRIRLRGGGAAQCPRRKNRGGSLHPGLPHPALVELYLQAAPGVRRSRRGHLRVGPGLLRAAGHAVDQCHPRRPALYQPPPAHEVLHGQSRALGEPGPI